MRDPPQPFGFQRARSERVGFEPTVQLPAQPCQSCFQDYSCFPLCAWSALALHEAKAEGAELWLQDWVGPLAWPLFAIDCNK